LGLDVSAIVGPLSHKSKMPGSQGSGHFCDEVNVPFFVFCSTSSPEDGAKSSLNQSLKRF
jgi:hypothetical protein